MFFANEQRDNVREENPGITFGTIETPYPYLGFTLLTHLIIGQVGKVLGERWKALNEEQRGPYEESAAKDKKRYEEEKANYNVSISLERSRDRKYAFANQ